MTSYPAAPWTLTGHAVQTIHLLDIRRARIFVPSELEIVSVLPGHTLGGVYLSAYKQGSTLKYNELIVVAALVRYENRIGSWISHIYVDLEDSVAGGREIWGLPKELAQFTWMNNSVSVRQDELLCRLDFTKEWYSLSSWWRQPFSGNVFSGLGAELLMFNAKLEAKGGLLQGHLDIPDASPLAKLHLQQPWLTLDCQQLRVVTEVPETVGKKTLTDR
ncbi:MAG: acetoacetate decarboxylase family protein [Cyanophyceae cyanobacterium]